MMSVEAEIRRRIQERGAITFAEFMEAALFWPHGGYYTTADPIGAGGDYYTSPTAHPAFGVLLSLQLYQTWLLLERPAMFTVAELGAGNGLLCRDILFFAAALPGAFRQSIHYLCVDRRAGPGLEADLPPEAANPPARRLAAANLPLSGVTGCVLSNEFLDAWPVHQVCLQDGKLKEVYVTLDGGALAPQLGEPSTLRLAQRLEQLGVALAEGQTAEINLGLEAWAEETAAALERGLILTIDYGDLAPALYDPARRRRGALVTYYRHRQTDSPFKRVGQQDMTAHVDFTSVINAGRQAGLEPLGFAMQDEFLRSLGLLGLLRRLRESGLPAPQAAANRYGMQTLADPDGLGGFKVLAQGKGLGNPVLWGFSPSAEAEALLKEAPLPLLTPQHVPLLAERYPSAEFTIEGFAPWLEGHAPGKN